MEGPESQTGKAGTSPTRMKIYNPISATQETRPVDQGSVGVDTVTGAGVAEPAGRLDQALVVRPAGRAAAQVGRQTGQFTGRITPGQLGLDVPVQHLKPGGAAGIHLVTTVRGGRTVWVARLLDVASQKAIARNEPAAQNHATRSSVPPVRKPSSRIAVEPIITAKIAKMKNAAR